VVELAGRPRGRVGVIARRHQAANPRGGSTLALELPAMGPRARRALEVRIVPSSGGGTVSLRPQDPAPTPTPGPTEPAG
jgi:hypothetical protein